VGFHAAGKIAGQHEELSGEIGPKLSGVVSNSWADDTMGLLASFAYQQRDARTDVAESIFVFSDAGDNNGDGVAGERLNSFAASVAQQERERIGGTLAFQYQPNDDTQLVVDALYTKFDSPSRVNGYSFFPSPSALTPGSVTVNNSNQIIAHETPGAVVDFVTRRNVADTDTIALGINFENRLNDRWTSEFDVGYSKADGQRDNVGSANGSGSFYVLGLPGGKFTQSPGGSVPNVTFTGPGAIPISQISANDIRLHFARNTFTEVTDEVLTTKADFAFEANGSTTIKLGFDYTDREKSNQVFDNIATQCQFCGYATPFTNHGNAQGLFTTFDDNFLDSGGGNIPRAFPIFSIESLEAAYNNFAASAGIPSPLSTSPNLQASNVVEESVLGAYIQADYSNEMFGVPFTANAGVRFAKTDLTSTGVGAQITGAAIETGVPIGLEPAQNFDINATAPRVVDNDYSDVLPSLNINFELSNTSQLRAAFSQSLTRPTLTDLSTFFDITSSNVGGEAITSSNPLLEPVRSNNFDISYEHYGDTGLSYSAALFYKDISDFITNRNTTESIEIPNARDFVTGAPLGNISRTFIVSSPQNGDEAEVYGLELASQYLFDSGLGLSANVTFSDSSATSADGTESDLENISDFSANASVFYEANGWQARASVNHRSEYLFSTQGEGGLAEFVDDYTQVDLSIGYDIGLLMGSDSDLTLFLEGINVTGEDFFRYSETTALVETFEVNGARWTFGIRGSF